MSNEKNQTLDLEHCSLRDYAKDAKMARKLQMTAQSELSGQQGLGQTSRYAFNQVKKDRRLNKVNQNLVRQIFWS